MKKAGLVNEVTNEVWTVIFEYLEIKDFLKLGAVSKHLKNSTESYTQIYERECLRIFSSDLTLFRYIY